MKMTEAEVAAFAEWLIVPDPIEAERVGEFSSGGKYRCKKFFNDENAVVAE
jgi:hypothetical protein